MIIGGTIKSVSDFSSCSFIEIEGAGVEIRLMFQKDDPRVMELASAYRQNVTVEVNTTTMGVVRRIA